MRNVLLIVAVINIAVLCASLDARAADSFADQMSYVTPSSPAHAVIDGYCQGFIPNVDVTTSISVYIKNSVPGSALILKIADPIKVHATSSVNLGGGFKWENFSLSYSPNVKNLSKGRQYYICLSTAEPTVTWSYSSPGGYASGTASLDEDPIANEDFGFFTYGYDNVEPAAIQPSTPALPDSSTSSPDTASTSQTQTDSSSTSNLTGQDAASNVSDGLTDDNLNVVENDTAQKNAKQVSAKSWWLQNWGYSIIAIIMILLIYAIYRLAKKKGLLGRDLFKKTRLRDQSKYKQAKK